VIISKASALYDGLCPAVVNCSARDAILSRGREKEKEREREREREREGEEGEKKLML